VCVYIYPFVQSLNTITFRYQVRWVRQNCFKANTYTKFATFQFQRSRQNVGSICINNLSQAGRCIIYVP